MIRYWEYGEDIWKKIPIDNDEHAIRTSNKNLVGDYIENFTRTYDGDTYTYKQILKLNKILSYTR
jgi:hypothetical protein